MRFKPPLLRLAGTRRMRRTGLAIVVLTGALMAGMASAENIVTTLNPGDTATINCQNGTALNWQPTSDLAGTLTCEGSPTTTTTAPPTTTTTTAPTTTTTTLPPASGGSPDPLDCTGYPEWRTFLEAQSWWVDAQNPFPGQHIHLGTCFPLHQTVRGKVHFDIRIMAHNNPGRISKLAVQVFGNGSIQTKSLDLNCQVKLCTWWVPFDLDTTKMPYNGRWEFRVRSIVERAPNGNRQFNSTRWHATLDNPGKTWRDASNPISRSPGGAGWYTGVDYVNVYCGGGGYDFVRRPQSGTVKLSCRFDGPAFASIDGNFHMNDPGWVVLDSATNGTKTITIDTTKLANGKHRLFVRTEKEGTNPAGTGYGAEALVFDVRN